MFTVIAGFLAFVFVCALAAAVGFAAQRGAGRSQHRTLGRHTAYIRFMQDKQDLNRIGFAQQLTRRMSGMSAFGLSFSTLSVVCGAVFLLGPAIAAGGPAGIGFGWPALALFGLAVSCSLASLASATPTAGGCYHWALAAGGKRSALAAGWLHAVGAALLLAMTNSLCADWMDHLAGARLGYTPGRGSYLIVLLAVFASQAIVGMRGSGRLGRLFAGASWLHMAAAVVAIAAAAALSWPSAHPLALIYGTGTSSAEAGASPSLLVGLLLMQRMFLGADTAAHGAEETVDPRIGVPWAIYLAVVYTFLFGFVLYAMALLQYPLGLSADYMTYDGLSAWIGRLAGLGGGFAGTFAGLLVFLLAWNGGLSLMTAAGRGLFALARDGAAPMAGRLEAVSERLRGPARATIWAAAGAALPAAVIPLLGWSIADRSVLVQLAALSVASMHAAYAIPIALKIAAGRKGGTAAKEGPWTLGRAGKAADRIALAWLPVSAAAALCCARWEVLAVVAALALPGWAGMEIGYRRLRRRSGLRLAGDARLGRQSLEDIMRIERKFPQY